MRTRLLVVFALVLLFSFAGQATAAEPWADLTAKECKQVLDGADSQAYEDLQALESAIFLAGTPCSTVADCPCPYQPACFCTPSNRCLCNQFLCCPGGECP